jgi:hypothetical protein
MNDLSLKDLQDFILRAKSSSYVGAGAGSPSCRPMSHDLQYAQGDWLYIDSYFGGSDFIGEEAVWYKGNPVWAMNYYGYILRPELISPAQTGGMIRSSLSHMYMENRFLGGFQRNEGDLSYFDTSEGDVSRLTGHEWIQREGIRVYELVYHGGLIKA